MTAKELILSILTYHVAQQYKLYAKPTNIDAIKSQGEQMYKDINTFFAYHKSNNDGRCAIRLTEKQANFLRSLIRKEGNKVSFDGFYFEVDNPSYLTSAYGGFVGKAKDFNKFILRMKRLYNETY